MPPLSDLEPHQAYRVLHLANDILEAFEGGAWEDARQWWIEGDLDNDERVEAWAFFDSKQRAWLKQDARKYIDEYTQR